MSDKDDLRREWEPLLDDLARRGQRARAMGGPTRLERQHREGRLDARQRIEALCDGGSFRELGALVGGVSRGGLPPAPADALVAGFASVEGRPLLVGAEDFTVQGGSIGLGTHAKRIRLARLAAQERVPLVMLLEGAGERVTNALERYPYAPNDLQALVELSGLVPTVAVVMGASAGHGALTAPLMDFVVMVEGAALFSAGPPLVAAATSESVSKQELGGAEVHTAHSGVAHNSAPSDRDALALARRYLGYFPSNAWQHPPRKCVGDPDVESGDLGERRLDGILDLVSPNPRKPYDMRRLVDMLADRDSTLELQPRFGASMLTILLRLGGQPVAVVANQPLSRAGSIERDGADKAAHFLELVDAFHLPVVFLADTPGVLAGSAAERSGALRSAARMFAAQFRLRGPKLHVGVRKAYGFGSSIMAMNPFDGQTLALAFPGATLGAMPAEGGGSAAGADAETQRQLDAGEVGGPWSAADTMSYDDVIDPRELRNALLRALRLTENRRSQPPEPVRRSGIRP
jgi:acetyl-CoA carboxylase carboxyltransferase component